MKSHNLRMLAVAGGLVVACQSAADINGIVSELYVGPGWVSNGYDENALDTYRVYVTFTNSTDQLIAVFGNMLDELTLTSGCGYVNTVDIVGNHSDTAPVDYSSVGYWANQWDTFCTIGREFGGDDMTGLGDQTGVTTDFCNEAGGNGEHAFFYDLFVTNAAWFCPPTIFVDDGKGGLVEIDTPQSIAGGGLRVLAMQITVPEGAVIQGNFNAQGGQTPDLQEFDLMFGSAGVTCAAATGFVGWRGVYSSGDANSLLASDDDRLCYTKGLTLGAGEAPVTLYFDGTLPTQTPASLSFAVESSANTPNLELSLSMFNWNTTSFELVHVSNEVFPNDAFRSIALSGDLSRFVQNGTGAVRGRYELRRLGLTLLSTWGGCVDQVYWTFTE